MSLGENIKNKRQELKLSQEYLADQLGVSRQAVSKWETALLFLCSLWMARNLMYETNLAQRKKNSRIELAYCCVQLVIAYVTYRFTLGLMGSLLILAVLLVYVLCINPKYMNRPFGKKLLADKRLQ